MYVLFVPCSPGCMFCIVTFPLVVLCPVFVVPSVMSNFATSVIVAPVLASTFVISIAYGSFVITGGTVSFVFFIVTFTTPPVKVAVATSFPATNVTLDACNLFAISL